MTITLHIWFCFMSQLCTPDTSIHQHSWKLLDATILQCEYLDAITNVGRDYQPLAERHSCTIAGNDL
jgi:hypothetical protein